LRQAADDLRQNLEKVEPESFQHAVMAEGFRRIAAFLAGVEAYRHHPYRRCLQDPSVIWQEGTTRLLDYSLPGASGVPILVVPSLINRAYILDLTAKRSFMRSLANKGFCPFLVDWGQPGPQERPFCLDDYVAGRLGRILDAVSLQAGRPVLIGYCMGGLLALALGVLRQEDVRGLVLLATPWDFHAPSSRQALMLRGMRKPFDDAIDFFDGLPVDLLQALFSTIEPGAIARKFSVFGQLKSRSAKARDFVALEDWLNDGVPLVGRVARECLFGWYVDNVTGRGLWQLSGKTIIPQTFTKPSLVLIPQHDRIVPPESALVLAKALPGGCHRLVPMGHIGMIAGTRSKVDVLDFIGKWLIQLG
jgi:polyhydroxyalkanoate synthase